jgi:hypothetical protein
MKNVKSYGEYEEESKNLDQPDIEQSETEAGSTKEIIMYEKQNLLKEISTTLNSIIQENNKNSIHRKDNSLFARQQIPKISIFDYLLRIQRYSGIEESTMILSLIYIDRICKKKGIVLSKYNIHRLLFIAILIAIKYNEDIIYDNLYYSKIGGVTKKELLILENEFLKLIDFNLFVSNKMYQKYYDYLNFR